MARKWLREKLGYCIEWLRHKFNDTSMTFLRIKKKCLDGYRKGLEWIKTWNSFFNSSISKICAIYIFSFIYSHFCMCCFALSLSYTNIVRIWIDNWLSGWFLNYCEKRVTFNLQCHLHFAYPVYTFRYYIITTIILKHDILQIYRL